MAFTEFYSNRASCTLTAGYTAGSGSITVSSTTGDDANYPFPVTAPFRLSLWTASTQTFRVILKVTAITDGTHFAVTAEGHDANASSGDTCYGVITAAALTAIRTDAGTDANLTLTDITTNNVSTSKHGFAPKAPNDATKYLDGTGAYSVPAGSGALVLLEQHTASASATLNFTTCISATYDTYLVEFVNLLPSATADLQMRMSTDGGSTYDSGSNYGWANTRWITTIGVLGGSTSDTKLGITTGSSVALTNYTWSGDLQLYNPGGSQFKRFKSFVVAFDGTSSGANPDVPGLCGGTYRNTTAVNAFQFFPSSGNFTSGTIRVYGLTK